MNDLLPVITFIAGTAFGFGVYALLNRQAKSNLADMESVRRDELNAMVETMKGSFAEVSLESLSKNSDEFFRVAKSFLDAKAEEGGKELDGKKALIDGQLANMKEELDRVHKLMTDMEKERASKFSEIAQQIRNSVEQTDKLTDITGSLNRALSSTTERGRWGERMALDIIRATGMIENVNYVEQKTMSNGSRPDFTFFLPKGFCVNMDVKFPFDSYLKYCSAEAEEQEHHAKSFIRDVRQKIKDINGRGYVDSEDSTIDVVLMFIPNESVYEFIYEKDPSIMDLAVESGVVLTSPLSLFAVLSVIRQAVENFAFEATSGEILKLFGTFYKQWDMFISKMDKMGQRITDAQKEYEILMSTRRNQLERPLEKIENIRKESGY